MYKVITPPATEPVSLSDVRMALRIDSTDFAESVESVQSIAPGTHEIASLYSLIGTGADILGCSALVILESGSNGTGGKVNVKIQESYDNTTFTDWENGSFTQVTESNDNTTYEKLYTGKKQYIRAACTVSDAECEFAVSILIKSSTTDEDDKLRDFITAAREYGEGVTRRAFATQTIDVMLDSFSTSKIEIPMPPLQSVESVKYKKSDGEEIELNKATEYIIDADGDFGKIMPQYGNYWPSFTPYPTNPIKIRCVVGYTEIPKLLKNAILLHVGLMYKYRDKGIPQEDMKTVDGIYRYHKAGWF